MATTKGFIKDWKGNKMLPITRGELVLDKDGNIALTSPYFAAGGNNEYGLISKTDLAKISGSSGESLGDIYNKLSYINSGIKVGNTALKFYDDASGAQKYISIAGTNGVSVGVNDNSIQVALSTVLDDEVEISNQVIKNITVDTFGRVTSVSTGTLSNSEIPSTLQNKTLTGCTTTNVPEVDNALVNKKYVDDAVAGATGIATGALKFGGTITTQSDLSTLLSNTNNVNSYYKITENREILTELLATPHTGILNSDGDAILAKAGDTVIIHKSTPASSPKFVYVPSADEYFVSVVQGNKKATSTHQNVTVDFADIFGVSVTNGYVKVGMSPASASQDGYLSKEDYATFKNSAGRTIEYEETTKETDAGAYLIGTFTVGTTDYAVYGKNNVSSLTLEGGTESDPAVKLKFTETGQEAKYITVSGGSGVKVSKTNDSIVLAADITSGNATYITASGNTVSAKLGSFTEDGYTNGLVSFEQLINALTNLSQNLTEVITTSLYVSTEDGGSYKYGSSTLVTAITVDI